MINYMYPFGLSRIALIALVIVSAASVARLGDLPKCDRAESYRIGKQTVEICEWKKEGAESQGYLQIAVVSDKGMVDVVTDDILGEFMSSGISDLDGNQNPEVYVLAQSAGSGSYPELHMYELRGGELEDLTLPELDELQAHGYMGHDRIVFEADRIIREFPIYGANDVNAQPTGATRRMIYRLSSKRLTLESRVDIAPSEETK